jgi:hypothetical protein
MNAELHEIEREVDNPATSMAVMTAITKAELDQQITTAHAFPRSLKRFVNECMDMATLNEDVAASCMYALPRGGKKIEGGSARLAEIVQSAWRNNRSGQRIVDEGDEFVTAQGIFHDLERNVMITVEVKRRITDKDGKRFNTDMIGVTGNAASSIAHRNAVFKGVPKAFWEPIYLAAKKAALGKIKSITAKRTELLDWLSKRGVAQEMVLGALGIQGVEDIGTDELETLIGMISAIKSGEATIEAAFAPAETRAPQGKPSTKEPQSKQPTAAAVKGVAGKKDGATKASKEQKAAADIVTITLDQATSIADSIKEEGVALTRVLAGLEVGSLEEIPADSYDKALALILELSHAG